MIATKCCPNHIHILICILSKYSVSEIVRYLEGKSSLIILIERQFENTNMEIECFGVDNMELIQLRKIQKNM